jgi:PA-IL-like protein
MIANRVLAALLAGFALVTGEASAAFFDDVSIAANSGWVDTGIEVRAGDLITISATGSASPNGVNNFNGPDGDGGDCGTCISLVPGSRYALVGRIGAAGAPFLVGSSFSATASEAGELFLGFNDDFHGDNGGSFVVSGSVVPEPSLLGAGFAAAAALAMVRRLRRRS